MFETMSHKQQLMPEEETKQCWDKGVAIAGT